MDEVVHLQEQSSSVPPSVHHDMPPGEGYCRGSDPKRPCQEPPIVQDSWARSGQASNIQPLSKGDDHANIAHCERIVYYCYLSIIQAMPATSR